MSRKPRINRFPRKAEDKLIIQDSKEKSNTQTSNTLIFKKSITFIKKNGSSEKKQSENIKNI